jgi:hypothetical protein
MAKSMKLRFEGVNLAPIQIHLMGRLGWEVETKTVDWNTPNIYSEVRLPKKDNLLADYLIMCWGRTWEVVEIPPTLGLVKPNGRPPILKEVSQLAALRALRDCKTVALAARRVGVSRSSLWFIATGRKGAPASQPEIENEGLSKWVPSEKNPHSYSKTGVR